MLNPNRMPLRYQGQFPPPRNNFASARAPATVANNTVDANEASVTNVDQNVTAAAAEQDEDQAMMQMWQSMPDTYFDPLQESASDYPRRRRRRQRKSSVFDPPATSVMLSATRPVNAENARASATVATLTAQAKPRSLGSTCVAIVPIRGMPCEALVDTGSRISLVEAGYLKGLLLKSGAKLEETKTHKSDIPVITCANRSTLSAAAAMTAELAYGGHYASVELQVATEKLAFPLILGTNCLSELGFQLKPISTQVKNFFHLPAAKTRATTALRFPLLTCVLQIV